MLASSRPVTIGYDCGPGTLAPKSAEVGLVILAFMSSSPPANDAMAEYSVACSGLMGSVVVKMSE